MKSETEKWEEWEMFNRERAWETDMRVDWGGRMTFEREESSRGQALIVTASMIDAVTHFCIFSCLYSACSSHSVCMWAFCLALTIINRTFKKKFLLTNQAGWRLTHAFWKPTSFFEHVLHNTLGGKRSLLYSAYTSSQTSRIGKCRCDWHGRECNSIPNIHE